jgi:hypothetical protein
LDREVGDPITNKTDAEKEADRIRTAIREGRFRQQAGVPVTFVSKIRGHTNLSTTSRYLNIHRRGLHAAMQKLEQHPPPLHNRCTKRRRTPKLVGAPQSLQRPPSNELMVGAEERI